MSSGKDVMNLLTDAGDDWQFAADAEKEDNIAEQKRQHGKRVRYGEIVQVSNTD